MTPHGSVPSRLNQRGILAPDGHDRCPFCGCGGHLHAADDLEPVDLDPDELNLGPLDSLGLDPTPTINPTPWSLRPARRP